jgi:PAS domain S-box-containing protein
MEVVPAFVSPSVVSSLRHGSRIGGLVVGLTGLLALVGWAWDVAVLKSLDPSWATMKANTASCFVVLGVSLWLFGDVTHARRQLLGRLLALVPLVLAGLTLSQDVFGWDLAIDQLLFVDRLSSVRPGRMAASTALLLVLASTATIRLDGLSLGRLTSQWLGLVTAITAVVTLCGYLYGVDALYAIPGFGSLSVYTAFGFLLLGLSILAAQPRGGLMLVLSANTSGGTLARRLLPVIVIAPIALGWVRLVGERRGLYGTAFGIALFAVSNVLTLGTIAWFTCRRLIDSEFRSRQVHDDLAESRRRLSTTLRSVGDAVIATDADERVMLMNPVAEQLTGWTAALAMGHPLDDVFSIISEESGARAESPARRVLREGIVVGLANHTALVARDGRVTPIADSGAPIVHNDGHIEGVVLVFRDMTAEREAERALRRSPGLLQAISDNASAVIYAKDLDGRYLLVNRRFAELFNLNATQVLGRTDYDLFSQQEADVFRQMDDRVAAAGVALTAEEPVPLGDGVHTYVSVKCPLWDEAGRVYAVFGISTDITDRKRAEDALRANEESTRLIVETALDGIVTMDARGTITGWNAQAETMFGWPRQEAIGRVLADTIVPEPYRESHRRGLTRFIATGKGPALNQRLELSALHRDGREFPIELSITPVWIGSGVSFSAFVRDIGERQRMEHALRESRQHYQALAESLPHLVWTCRPDGYCDFLSRQWVEYTGRPAEEQLGYGWAEQLHPEDRDRVEAGWAAATQRGDTFDIEFRIRRADGAFRWFKTRAVPLRDASGGIVRWFGSNTDVDDYKTSEQRLHAQLERMNLLDRLTRAIGERQDLQSILQVVVRSLEDHLPVDFCCVALYDRADESLVVTRVGVNSQALALELAMPEKARIRIGSNGLSRCVRGELVHEPDVTLVSSPFPQRLAAGGLRSLVAAPLVVESHVFGVLIAARRASPGFSSQECEFLRQLSEHVALAAHQAELYTALQRAYEDLRQTQQAVMQQERLKALGQMASGIAHDINNAISPVAIYTESLLETDDSLSPRARDYLSTIQRAIDDVGQTVARMREFYREHEAQLTLTPVAVNRLVREVVQLTRARWSDMPQQRGVVVEATTELAPADPIILGLESEIREALINLVFNAVDAMPDGGRLTLRTRVIDGSTGPRVAFAAPAVHIEVADTGVGMDVDTRRRCLEPFFTTKGERGTGLGLAMVYGTVQRHSADIDIDSAPGRGTTVKLTFPAPTEVVGDSLSVPRELPRPARLRILLVDDDPLLLKSLQDVLETEGHHITAANGGQAGIDAFTADYRQGGSFNVVITDLGMPYVDGREVARVIKAAAADMRVILLTGWGRRMLDDGDLPAHVDRILTKPPRLSELRAALFELTSTPPASHRGERRE